MKLITCHLGPKDFETLKEMKHVIGTIDGTHDHSGWLVGGVWTIVLRDTDAGKVRFCWATSHKNGPDDTTMDDFVEEVRRVIEDPVRKLLHAVAVPQHGWEVTAILPHMSDSSIYFLEPPIRLT